MVSLTGRRRDARREILELGTAPGIWGDTRWQVKLLKERSPAVPALEQGDGALRAASKGRRTRPASWTRGQEDQGCAESLGSVLAENDESPHSQAPRSRNLNSGSAHRSRNTETAGWRHNRSRLHLRPGPSSTVSFQAPSTRACGGLRPCAGSFLDKDRSGDAMQSNQAPFLFIPPGFNSTHLQSCCFRSSRGFCTSGPQPMFHCKARTLRVVLHKSLVHLERPILRVQIGCPESPLHMAAAREARKKLRPRTLGRSKFCTRLALPSSSFQRPGSSPSLEPGSRIRNRPLDGNLN